MCLAAAAFCTTRRSGQPGVCVGALCLDKLTRPRFRLSRGRKARRPLALMAYLRALITAGTCGRLLHRRRISYGVSAIFGSALGGGAFSAPRAM